MKKLFVAPELDVVRLFAIAHADDSYDETPGEGGSEADVDVSDIPV